jgi:anti-sigma B factor antagonist
MSDTSLLRRFECESRDGVTLVRFTEPLLDEENRWIIDKQVAGLIDSAAPQPLVLDFCNVKFLSSAAIGALLDLQRKAKKSKVAIRLSRLAPELEAVFHASGLGDQFGLSQTGP